MQSYDNFKKPVRALFCDIDDTLTTNGQLHAEPYNMLWKLAESGVHVIPITGRPAGWCEMIARLWPVKGVIGENGAFYFSYQDKVMKRVFACDEGTRKKSQQKLKAIEQEVLKQVPGCALASDQFCRLFDLAVDFCEDVSPLPQKDISKIVEIFKAHGATAKVSSIHVNGWFGEYDKKSMCQIFYESEFGHKIEGHLEDCAFVGDSPNDEPMFGFFENSFAVDNIKPFLEDLSEKPKYLISKEGGEGFVLLAKQILKNLP